MENNIRSQCYKYCFVPQCDSSTEKHPSKIFVQVPQKESIRKQWLKIVRRNKPTSNKSCLYCCEDHFNLKEDLENYTRIKLDPGANVRLKKGSCPRFFECQKDRKRSFPGKPRPAAEKLKKIRLVKELLNDSHERTHQDIITDSTNEGTSLQVKYEINQLRSPKHVRSIGTQVRGIGYRSVGSTCVIESRDVSCQVNNSETRRGRPANFFEKLSFTLTSSSLPIKSEKSAPDGENLLLSSDDS